MPAIAVRRVLQKSSAQITHQELLGQDIDIESFKLIIQKRINPAAKQLADRIIAADVTRTIEGASTLSVSIVDQKRELWKSGNFGEKLDVRVDGLWFRLASVNKAGDILNLVFEDREIGILRTYNKFIAPVSRSDMTRAEFILKLLNDVREITIPYEIPELHDPQPVFNKNDIILHPYLGNPGINKDEQLTVKGSPADAIQIANADLILRIGDGDIPDSHPRKRKLLVCSIMTAIVESRIQNLLSGDLDSQGLFQQRPSQGWYDVTNEVAASHQFFTHALAEDLKDHNLSYNDLCQNVQRSGHPDRYGLYRTEAERFVEASGRPGGDALAGQAQFNAQGNYQTASARYHFYRGVPPSRKNGAWTTESSWECIQRLAKEVNWRAFFVSGTFYYISEDKLFTSQPRAILDEDSDGIDSIDGDYDPNKAIAEITIPCRMGRWLIPPGSTIKLKNSGPFNGRWLVTTIERDLFQPTGVLTLSKPNPRFMEPNTDSLPTQYSGATHTPKSNLPASIKPPYPEPQWSDIKFLANVILGAYGSKPQRYRDDNGSQISQWRKLAAGQPLHSQCGFDTGLDIQVAQVLVYLLENGWYIGTYAVMEDHSCCVKGTGIYPDCTVSAHAMGAAVDISSLGKPGLPFISLATTEAVGRLMAKEWLLDIMVLLRGFNPDQIICNGCGGLPDLAIAAVQWNKGEEVSHITDGHLTHLHVGFPS